MWTEQLLTAIVLGVLGLGTVGIIIWGNRRRSGRLRLLGFSLLLLTIFFVFDSFPEYAVKFSAWATVVIAIAAFAAIEESIRLRRQNQRRENRDRQDHRLKEIIEWATQILVCGRALVAERLAANISGAASISISAVVRQEFNVLTWQGAYIRFVADRLDPIIALNVAETRKYLLRHIKVLDLEEKFKDRSAVGRHRRILDDSARRLIEEAVNLLTQDVRSDS